MNNYNKQVIGDGTGSSSWQYNPTGLDDVVKGSESVALPINNKKSRSKVPVAGSMKFGKMTGEYFVMPQANNYAKGVEELNLTLKNTSLIVHPTYNVLNGAPIYRPLTFKENIEARVNEFNSDKNSDEQKLVLFNTSIDSCTGIAYNSRDTKFAIVPMSYHLITIDPNSTNEFLNIAYSIIPYTELDSGIGKYNQPLTESDVITHRAWLTVLENDTKLLEEYAKITFNLLKKRNPNTTTAMGFYVRQNTSTDELRALFVEGLGNFSSASGNFDLYSNVRFLSVASQKNSNKLI